MPVICVFAFTQMVADLNWIFLGTKITNLCYLPTAYPTKRSMVDRTLASDWILILQIISWVT